MRPNKQNETILSATLHAQAAVRSLVNRGITVRSLSIEDGKPLITVDSHPACRDFKGEDYCVKHGLLGKRVRMRRAEFLSCRVAWEIAA